MKKTCKYCGEEFNSSREHRTYCSTECYHQTRKKYLKQYYREYRLANKEKFQAYMKEYYLKKKIGK